MKCPFSYTTLELIRASGAFRPMTVMDYRCYAGAPEGTVIWYNDEWTVLYGEDEDDVPEVYQVLFDDSAWEDTGDEPIETRCWRVTATETREL
jgi:hypothetical protein